jgi:hypothetical protein
VGGPNHNRDGRVADLQPSHPVLQRHCHRPARLGLGDDASTFGFRHRSVRGILEADNLAPAVVIAHGAEESGYSAMTRRVHLRQ